MSCELNAIILKKGETYNGAICTYKNNLDAVINITNFKIKIHFKKEKNSDVIDFLFSTENNTIVFVNATLGTFRLQPRLMNYDVGVYYGDFFIENLSQNIDISTNEMCFKIENAITQ